MFHRLGWLLLVCALAVPSAAFAHGKPHKPSAAAKAAPVVHGVGRKGH